MWDVIFNSPWEGIVASSLELPLSNVTLPNSATAAAYLAALAANPKAGGQTAISDTAADLSSVWASLMANASGIASIRILDSKPLSLTPAEYVGDKALISKTMNASGGALTCVIAGSASDIESNFNNFVGSSPSIAQIEVTGGGTLTLNAEQAANDVSLAVAAVAGGGPFTVADTGANLGKFLTGITSLASNIASIVVTDSAPVSLTAAAFLTDTASEALLSNANGGPVALAVTDTSANVAQRLDALEKKAAEISQITATNLSGSDDTFLVSMAQFDDDQLALGKIVTSGAAPAKVAVGVSDTVAQVQSHLDQLDDALGAGALTKIVLTDPTDDLALSAAQFLADSKAIAALVADNPAVKFELTDSVADIQANLSALASSAGASHIAAVNATDSQPLTLSVEDILSIGVSPLLLAWRNTNLTIEVVDTADQISRGLDALAALGSCLSDVVISDDEALNLTAAQAADDTLAIGLLSNANAQSPVTINVADAAANISHDFTALANLTLNGVDPIASIVDADADNVVLSVDDYFQNGATVRKIQGASGFDIADTATNISAALPALHANIKNIGAISITDGFDILLSAAQQSTYADVLAKLQPAGSVVTLPVVNWATFSAHAATYRGLSTGFALSDTAANIVANLQAMNGIQDLAYIVVNSGALQLSAAQIAYDSQAVGLLVTPSVTQARFSVADSALNVAANLDALQAVAGRITSIATTGGAPLPGIRAAQISNDALALSRLSTKIDVVDSDDGVAAYFGVLASHISQIASIEVTGGALQLTGADIANGQPVLNALYAGDNSIQLLVSDTGANIVGALDSLQSNLSHIATISISDFDDALTVSAARYIADDDAIGVICTDNPGAAFSIVDTAANISKYLDRIGGASTITISDNAPIDLTMAQLSNDSRAIYALGNSDALPVEIDVVDTAANFANGQNLSQLPSGVVSVVRDDANAILANAAALQSESMIGAIDATGGAAEIARDAGGILAVQPDAATTHGFSVTDTAAHISQNLDLLAGVSDLTSVVASDGGSINVSVAQLSRDASVLATIEASAPNRRPLKLVDSFADAASSAGLAALQKAAGAVGSISLSGAATPFTAAQFAQYGAAVDAIGATEAITVADAANAMTGVLAAVLADKRISAWSIVDTAANIAASLDSLNTALQGAGAGSRNIVISDNAPLRIGQAQLGDALALARLKDANGKAYALDIVYTAANFASAQNPALLTQYASQIATEQITATVSQVAAADAFYVQNRKANPKLAGVLVQDTAANLESAWASLSPYSGDLTIDSSTPVVVDYADLAAHEAVLNDVAGGFTLTDATSNLGANPAQIAAALNLIQGDLGHISQLNLTGPLTGVSVATAIADAGVLKQVSGGFSIVDSAANIAAQVAALSAAQDLSEIASISLASGGVASLTVQQALAAAPAMSKLAGGFSIADTAAHVQAKIAALDSETASIVSMSVQSGLVHVNVASFASQAPLLDKIVGGVVVADSAAHIASAFAQLKAGIDAGHVAAIQILQSTSSGPIVFKTSAANDTAATYAEVLGAIQGPHLLQLTNARNAIEAQIGTGAGLAFYVGGGTQSLTGGGAQETFELAAAFGSATITDFAAQASGTAHDTITFDSWSDYTMLFSPQHLSFGGGATTISMGANRLVLEGMSRAQFSAAVHNGDFTCLDG